MIPELSRLATQAEHMVGVQRASSSHHHDLSDAITNRYNENVQKLKDVLKVSEPFATEERHLVNIITKAVMPVYVKEGVLTRDKIGQALFDTFARENCQGQVKCLEPHEKGKSAIRVQRTK